MKQPNIFHILIFTIFCANIPNTAFTQQPQQPQQQNYAVVINGGSDSDRQNKIDKDLADEFVRQLVGTRGLNKNNITRARSRSDIEYAIRNLGNIDCKCGDNIILYFIGDTDERGRMHLYTKDMGKTIHETITLEELKGWLNDALKNVPCCCKVHLIFNCNYCEKFIEELIKSNLHIVTGIGANDSRKLACAHLFPWAAEKRSTPSTGTWTDAVNQSLEGITVERHEEWQDALQEIQYDATHMSKTEEDPITLKRLDGHVTKVILPKYLLGPKEITIKRKDGKEHTVELSFLSKLKVGNFELDYCELKDSSHINVVARVTGLKRINRFGKMTGNYRVIGNPKVYLNLKGAKFHVDKVEDDKITISFVEPDFGKIETDLSSVSGIGIKGECQWFEINTGHLGEEWLWDNCDPRITPHKGPIYIFDATEITLPLIKFEGTIKKITDEYLEIHIKKPKYFHCNTKFVYFDSFLPPNLENGDDIIFKGYLNNGIIINSTFIKHIKRLRYDWGLDQKGVLPKPPRLPKEPYKPDVPGENFGDSTMYNIKVNCWIDSTGFTIYKDSTIIDELQPGEKSIVTFKEWTTGPEGSIYRVNFRSIHPKDENPENDTLSYILKILEVIPPGTDTIPPIVDIVTPNNGDTVSGNVTITATVNDNFDPNPLCEFFINDSLMGQAYTSPYEFIWNSSSFIPGSINSLKVKATDNSNNSSEDMITVIITDTGIANQPPVLSGADVVPDSGSLLTNFTFSVTYTDSDNDMPVIREAIIDSISYTMNYVSGTPLTGIEFQHQTILKPGAHSFTFKFDDGHGHIVTTPIYFGPTVKKALAINRIPKLTGGDVVPDSGDAITLFTYTIIYRDLDGDWPVIQKVFIDSIPHTMSFIEGTPNAGIKYEFQTTLSQGLHNFFFKFDDGHGHTVMTETYIGPRVIYY